MTALRDDELLIERTFDAPIALVFRLWESRDHMLRWWGPEEFTAVELDWELVPGRPWRGAMTSKTYGLSRFSGVIREVEKNRRIVFSFQWDEETGQDLDTIVTVTLREDDGRTLQTFHQAPFSTVARRDSHVGGWNSLFNKQQVYVENIAVAERIAPMITLTTYAWVPDFAAPLMRAFRVRWALEEAGLPYRVRTVALGPEQRSPEHLARQPFGQAPAIAEDGLVLFESGAIALHVAEASEVLLPQDEVGRARATGWLFAALNSVEPPVQELAGIDFFHADEAWTRERRPQVEAFVRDRLAMLERALGEKDYLEGRFTVGDLMMADVLRILDNSRLLEEYPALEAYKNRCEARPAFARAMKAQLEGFRNAA